MSNYLVLRLQRYCFFLNCANKSFLFLRMSIILCDFAVQLRLYMPRAQTVIYIVLIYLAVVNVVTFFLYGMDKWKAKRSKWRIEEATLLWLAAAGGSVGALLGMKAWHHKTQHRKFTWGVPVILIVQLALAGVIVYYYLI